MGNIQGRKLPIGDQKVEIVKVLGEGSFSFVFLVRNVKHHKQLYALKRILVADPIEKRLINNEIELMQLLQHKNIVSFHGTTTIPAGSKHSLQRDADEVYILMEYCAGGELVSIMAGLESGQRFKEERIIEMFCGVLEAVTFMHSQNPPVAHRDLKVENVLACSNGEVKICDFGSATTHIIPTAPNGRTREEVMPLEENINKYTTMVYRSPELIDLYGNSPINEKVDIWALGCMLYKLAFFQTPFENGSKVAIMNGTFTFPADSIYSPQLHDLIKYMLITDPVQRPDCFQIWEKLNALKSIPTPVKKTVHKSPVTPPIGVPMHTIPPKVEVVEEDTGESTNLSPHSAQAKKVIEVDNVPIKKEEEVNRPLSPNREKFVEEERSISPPPGSPNSRQRRKPEQSNQVNDKLFGVLDWVPNENDKQANTQVQVQISSSAPASVAPQKEPTVTLTVPESAKGGHKRQGSTGSGGGVVNMIKHRRALSIGANVDTEEKEEARREKKLEKEKKKLKKKEKEESKKKKKKDKKKDRDSREIKDVSALPKGDGRTEVTLADLPGNELSADGKKKDRRILTYKKQGSKGSLFSGITSIKTKKEPVQAFKHIGDNSSSDEEDTALTDAPEILVSKSSPDLSMHRNSSSPDSPLKKTVSKPIVSSAPAKESEKLKKSPRSADSHHTSGAGQVNASRALGHRSTKTLGTTMEANKQMYHPQATVMNTPPTFMSMHQPMNMNSNIGPTFASPLQGFGVTPFQQTFSQNISNIGTVNSMNTAKNTINHTIIELVKEYIETGKHEKLQYLIQFLWAGDASQCELIVDSLNKQFSSVIVTNETASLNTLVFIHCFILQGNPSFYYSLNNGANNLITSNIIEQFTKSPTATSGVLVTYGNYLIKKLAFHKSNVQYEGNYSIDTYLVSLAESGAGVTAVDIINKQVVSQFLALISDVNTIMKMLLKTLTVSSASIMTYKGINLYLLKDACDLWKIVNYSMVKISTSESNPEDFVFNSLVKFYVTLWEKCQSWATKCVAIWSGVPGAMEQEEVKNVMLYCQQLSIQPSFENYNPNTSLPPTAPLSVLQSTRTRAAVLTQPTLSPAPIAHPLPNVNLNFSPPNAHHNANLFNPAFVAVPTNNNNLGVNSNVDKVSPRGENGEDPFLALMQRPKGDVPASPSVFAAPAGNMFLYPSAFTPVGGGGAQGAEEGRLANPAVLKLRGTQHKRNASYDPGMLRGHKFNLYSELKTPHSTGNQSRA
eukprot:TRINITY_DN4324_c0_g1_i2.p1 TRINITY_DN4324_c0_g1~~TRINITY_DN4324_c0_g1_i2.p1  ORF type:complete len:1240 (+),score=284.20 TRINITY_DN4324_c0_g1_i2:1949-5668(+)